MTTPSAPSTPAIPALRIGEGWDTHALVTGRPLVLGGVTIPHTHGLLGHSDADALLHALTDALLGAAGMGVRDGHPAQQDRKSTRLNSSHQIISYAVFCLKKKKSLH